MRSLHLFEMNTFGAKEITLHGQSPPNKAPIVRA